jgi:hypothetical protein
MEIRASDGNGNNGANWGTMRPSGRISAKFQNVSLVPSGQRRAVMTCHLGEYFFEVVGG